MCSLTQCIVTAMERPTARWLGPARLSGRTGQSSLPLNTQCGTDHHSLDVGCPIMGSGGVGPIVVLTHGHGCLWHVELVLKSARKWSAWSNHLRNTPVELYAHVSVQIVDKRAVGGTSNESVISYRSSRDKTSVAAPKCVSL